MSAEEKVNILLVDDQPAKLLTIETILAELGENVIKANSAEEALAKLLTIDVAVVLVDVCMPRMDGFELAQMIRDHPRFDRTAIIFVSAVHMADADRLKGYRLGAVDYISVPIIPEILRAKVAVFTELFRKTEQLQRLNQELENRVAARTADVEASAARLRESEQRYRQLVHGLPAAVYTCDAEGRITLYNDAAVTLWGRQPQLGVDSWCGSWRIYRPDGSPLPLDECPMAVTLRDGSAIRGEEIIIERPDGTRRNVVPYPEPLFDASGKIAGAVNMLVDVTEARQAHQALRDSEDRFQQIAHTINEVFWLAEVKPVPSVLYISPAWEHIWGRPAAQVSAHPRLWFDTIHKDDRARVAEIFAGAVADSGDDSWDREYRIVRPDGEIRWIRERGRILRNGPTSPVRAAGLAEDVTERKAAAFERDRLLAVLEATPDFVATTDARGNTRYMNPAARRMIGLARDEDPTGRPMSDFHPPEISRFIFENAMPAAARASVWEGETLIRTRDGSRVPVSQVIIAHKDADGNVAMFSTIARDITQHKKAEAVLARDRATLERLVEERTAELAQSNERLRVSDRMATMGTLSAGLGHDLGNLLLPVRMRLDNMERCDLPDAVRSDITAIRSATRYLQRLAASLRLLSLDPDTEPFAEAATDVAEWWNEVEGVMRNGIPRPTILNAEIPQQLPRVGLGKASLTQVIFNLVQNAGAALASAPDGRITVSAGAAANGRGARLSVSDNGPGMTNEVKTRCQEPFFTTKTRGLGTGLGLTLVSGIVRRAAGTIEIRSEPGKGTTVEVFLPTSAGKAREGGPEPRPRSVAVVALEDRRLLAHVNAILHSLAFEVRNPGRLDDADVWIMDSADEGAFEAARRFTASRSARRAIVLGSRQEGDDLNSIVCLDASLKPSALRERLREILVEHGVAGGGAA